MSIVVVPFMLRISVMHHQELTPSQCAATFDQVDIEMIKERRYPRHFHKTSWRKGSDQQMHE